MSNPQSPAYREGIWEIRETTITALLPEGAWVLQVGDIEFIRMKNGTENGVTFCDAFIKPRDSSRPYPVGRYPSEKEGICKVLGQFADWNGVPLLDASGTAKTRPPAPAASGRSKRQVIPFPKSPDFPLQTEKAPMPEPAEDFIPQRRFDPNQGFDPQKGSDAGQGFDPRQDADSGQGFDSHHDTDSGQGFDPRQTWWQWAFNPANPQFRKTMIILSSIVVLLILLGASGVFRGLRLQSVSGPGIVGIYFFLRAMKNRKPKDRFGANNPPNASSWDPFAPQPGAWKPGPEDPGDTSDDSTTTPEDAASPEDSASAPEETASQEDSASAPEETAEKKDAHNPEVDRQDT